jgi:hypothetical protein
MTTDDALTTSRIAFRQSEAEGAAPRAPSQRRCNAKREAAMSTNRASSLLLVGVSLLLCMATACAHAAAIDDWVPWRSFVVEDYPANAHAGEAVALSTDWLAIGVPGDIDNVGSALYTQAGAVLIYQWASGGWQLRHNVHLTDVGGTPQTNAHFGAALALSGDRLLVGCPGCEAGWHGVLIDLSDPGSNPAALPIALLGAEEEVSDPDLGAGSAVALDGTLLAIGSPLAQPFGASGQIGVVDIGHLDGNGVAWDHTFIGEQAGSRFGAALALEVIDSGGTIPSRTTWLAVGAPAYVNNGTISIAGRAYLYRDTTSTDWNHVQIFANPQPGFADALGKVVAITFEQPGGGIGGEGLFAVGAPGRALDSIASGTVQVYRTATTNGTFALEQEIGLADGATFDRFGSALALLPTTLLVGANGRDIDLATEAGAAYRFERSHAGPQPQWPLRQTLLARGGNEAFGAAVAMASSRGAAIGAPDSSIGDTGAVHLYLCDGIFINGFDNHNGVLCDRF